MSSPQSRRSFLNLKSLGQAATMVTGGESLSPAAELPKPQEGWLYRASRPAMASCFEILHEIHEADRTAEVEAALDQIDGIEEQLSVYRESSLISRINRVAFPEEGMSPEARSVCDGLDEDVFGLLLESKRLWGETNGCFDIAIHPLLRLWGIYKPPLRTPSEKEIEDTLTCCGMGQVELDASARSIRFARKGMGLNLASIGKGYALDKTAARMTAKGFENFLMHGGNSSLIARGSSSWEKGWLAALVSPYDWEKPIAHIRLENQGLSTSALDAETIRRQRIAHVLDPRTGKPIESDLVSASVCAESATRAEGLSTAFLVMGLDKTLDYCEKHTDIGVVLLRCLPDSLDLEMIHTGFKKYSLEVLS